MTVLPVAVSRGAALGTCVEVVVTDAEALPLARAVLDRELAAADRSYSRFRPDSELSRLPAGRPVRVSPLLAEAFGAAIRAARLSQGLVDPTVARSLVAAGYDRDLAELPADGPMVRPQPAPGWWRLAVDPARRTVTVPAGVSVDLGAVGKALAADRAAREVHRAVGGGVLVNLGGDLATAGPPPPGGWRVRVGEHPEDTVGVLPGATIGLAGGALATSSVLARRWRRGGRELHHLVDPSTGEPARVHWRTVTVAAGSCVDANTASTAAILLGPAAPGWLGARHLPARLVAADGSVVRTSGWPEERP